MLEPISWRCWKHLEDLFERFLLRTTALKHSMGALFWVAVILLVVQVMMALLCSQLAISYPCEHVSFIFCA